jgi:hypothetical protein
VITDCPLQLRTKLLVFFNLQLFTIITVAGKPFASGYAFFPVPASNKPAAKIAGTRAFSCRAHSREFSYLVC